MSEFFLELFTEEIPANLQSTARENLKTSFIAFLDKENIKYKNDVRALSTPNRLVIYFKNINKEIVQNPEEVKGPSTSAPDKAIQGFVKSNRIDIKEIYKKETNKGEFYFFKKPYKKLKTVQILNDNMPKILETIKWKKSMKWGEFDLYWARPLKSILAIFDGKPMQFRYHHLSSSNFTFVDKDFEEKTKTFKNFNSYLSYFKNIKVIIDNELRKKKKKKRIN
mgnify:FL=1